jgi:hypothetical protein
MSWQTKAFLGKVIFKEGGHMLRTYSRIVGIGLALWGIAGLLGVSGQSPGRIVLFLGTSLIFLYAGFGRVSAMELRAIVVGMGILYLLSSGFLILVWAWMSTADDPEMPKILLRGMIGILSLLSARFLPQRDEERDRLPEVPTSVAKEAALPKEHAAAATSLPKEDHN